MTRRSVLALAAVFGFMLGAGGPMEAQARQPVPAKTMTWCEKAGVVVAGAGTAIAGVGVGSGALASSAGVAAVAHSSGVLILTSVGAGGAGYIAGTLGGVAATTLGVVSAPAVIATAATVGVAGVGTYAYCRFHR